MSYESPFTIQEGVEGPCRVYVFSAGLAPTGTREDAERLMRSLDHDMKERDKRRLFGTAERLAEARAEVARLQAALGLIAELGDRCEDCDPPDPIATHITTNALSGVPIFLCAEHAKDAREAHRKAESKGSGKQPEVEEHEQDTAVTIALRALGIAS